jgi:hypothetical protein
MKNILLVHSSPRGSESYSQLRDSLNAQGVDRSRRARWAHVYLIGEWTGGFT